MNTFLGSHLTNGASTCDKGMEARLFPDGLTVPSAPLSLLYKRLSCFFVLHPTLEVW